MQPPVPDTLVAIGRAPVVVWRLSPIFCVDMEILASRHNICEELIAFCIQTRACIWFGGV